VVIDVGEAEDDQDFGEEGAIRATLLGGSGGGFDEGGGGDAVGVGRGYGESV
jgi:hypothetical protein